jgi:hypothetical protein
MQIPYPTKRMKRRIMISNGKNNMLQKKLINIVVTIIPIHHESMVAGVSKIDLRYYVDVPTNSTTIN